mmetsp:Transcript_79071/g.173376  ORF Transcript_79071/g.173376 Transcript_79071/m.173376 type:complete len:99 (+) Transcript_79071:66-362(+)
MPSRRRCSKLDHRLSASIGLELNLLLIFKTWFIFSLVAADGGQVAVLSKGPLVRETNRALLLLCLEQSSLAMASSLFIFLNQPILVWDSNKERSALSK